MLIADRTDAGRQLAAALKNRASHDVVVLGLPRGGVTALVVDDGVATGSTARAACRVARAHGAARVVLAVPVAPPDVRQRFADEADVVVVLETPSAFHAVGQFYENFTQVTDDEVVELLESA